MVSSTRKSFVGWPLQTWSVQRSFKPFFRWFINHFLWLPCDCNHFQVFRILIEIVMLSWWSYVLQSKFWYHSEMWQGPEWETWLQGVPWDDNQVTSFNWSAKFSLFSNNEGKWKALQALGRLPLSITWNVCPICLVFFCLSFVFHLFCLSCVYPKGSCTYYVIADGRGSLQMITVLHGGGPPNYYNLT